MMWDAPVPGRRPLKQVKGNRRLRVEKLDNGGGKEHG